MVPDTAVVCPNCGNPVSDEVWREYFGKYAYAVSKDGIHWEKPVPGLKEFGEATRIISSPWEAW